MAEQRTFYDTFDWLLFAKSLILYQSGQDLTLRPLSGGGRVHCVRTSSPPAFARDLPQSSLKEQLQAVIEARALLRLADIHTRTSTYRVLNKDEKTVARLIYTDTRSSSESTAPVLAAYLSLRPVRGYAKYSRQLAKYLGPGQAISSMVGDIYRCALKATGQTPGSYSAKLDLQLDPDMRSAEAMKMILRRLLETMRANEAGIRADIDIEFLHDYRVAIRRTRSALTQIPNVFPDDITDRFKREFRLLGKGTNALRDLDVYLLAEPTYRAMLPDAMQDDIAPLFDYLRSQRAQALSDVIDVDSRLRGNDRVVLEDWAAFLNEPTSAIPACAGIACAGIACPPNLSGGTDAANAAVPIIDLARRRTYRKYRRIVKDGSYILDHTEDELLHALRIECKKLRYLLEFFASLFPPKKAARLIRQLKRLQDNLGEFTDLSVQQQHLRSIVDQLPADDPRTRKALVATGVLVAQMARRQQVVKAEFARTFTEFTSPANQKQYRRLSPRRRGGKRPGP